MKTILPPKTECHEDRISERSREAVTEASENRIMTHLWNQDTAAGVWRLSRQQPVCTRDWSSCCRLMRWPPHSSVWTLSGSFTGFRFKSLRERERERKKTVPLCGGQNLFLISAPKNYIKLSWQVITGRIRVFLHTHTSVCCNLKDSDFIYTKWGCIKRTDLTWAAANELISRLQLRKLLPGTNVHFWALTGCTTD